MSLRCFLVVCCTYKKKVPGFVYKNAVPDFVFGCQESGARRREGVRAKIESEESIVFATHQQQDGRRMPDKRIRVKKAGRFRALRFCPVTRLLQEEAHKKTAPLPVRRKKSGFQWRRRFVSRLSVYFSRQSFFFRSLLMRMAQKFGPHMVQYSPSFTLLSL